MSNKRSVTGRNSVERACLGISIIHLFYEPHVMGATVRDYLSWRPVIHKNLCGSPDQLAKDATQYGQPYSHTKLPKPHIKGLLRKRMLEEWQSSWKNGIQAGKSVISCPQLVSVPLTGLERLLSSSLNMDLSLPTSKGFTCLTAIFAAVVELARHFTMPRSVFIQCLGIRESQRQTSNKNG
ncbi:hypothetical protein AVEN_13105-1 [Araneus ventricosus]|uniref:Uncharacterized protein n=1 Tax=Araneus ventricosus TaxID=182803 RepID=A0A4Y2KBG7_ARAVE|nr:hypothetical protein AVEN_13105-1 [Araneus ventricosus]